MPTGIRRLRTAPAFHLPGTGQTITLNLFDDASVQMTIGPGTARTGGLISRQGAPAGLPAGSEAFFVESPRGITGRIVHEGKAFLLRPSLTGGQEIAELDPASFAPEFPPQGPPRFQEPEHISAPARTAQQLSPTVSEEVGLTPSVTGESVDQQIASAPSHPVPDTSPGDTGTSSRRRGTAPVIDVLALYTPAAAAAIADIEAEVQLAIDLANGALGDSQATTTFRLVHSEQIDYTESGNIITDLARLRSTADGHMDGAHVLRNAWLADTVALITNDGGGFCGVAYQLVRLATSFRTSAFSVTHLPCAAGNLTLGHELGHNAGLEHEEEGAGSNGAFSYARGYQAPDESFRTIMATDCTGGCPRVAQYSNPAVNFGGQPTGIASGQTGEADNVTALEQAATIVEVFRELTAPTSLVASASFTDRVELDFAHPAPSTFKIYRATDQAGPPAELEETTDLPYADVTATAGHDFWYWVSATTATGSESALTGPVAGRVVAPVCGNSIIEEPAENCDDGGSAVGDGCSPSCQLEPPPVREVARCILGMNKAGIKVAKAQALIASGCAKLAARGRVDDAQACLGADPKGKLISSFGSTGTAEFNFCGQPPLFGYSGHATVNKSSANEVTGTIEDLYGVDLHGALKTSVEDPGGSRCQQTTLKAFSKHHQFRLREFLSCKKNGLKRGDFTSAEDLRGCFAEVAADNRGKLAKSLEKLTKNRIRRCSFLDTAIYFPGDCAGTETATFDACVDAVSACRMCRMFNSADGLTEDCDLYDDGTANGTCPAVSPDQDVP